MTRASIKKKDLNLAAALLIMVSDSIHRDDICKISKLQDQERDSEWCAWESLNDDSDDTVSVGGDAQCW